MVISTWVYLRKLPPLQKGTVVRKNKYYCILFISHARQLGILIDLLSQILRKSTNKSLLTSVYFCDIGIIFKAVLGIRIRNWIRRIRRIRRIRILWGLLDPDPDRLVRVMDPAPDPSLFS